MFDTATAALLRAVFDEVCESVSTCEAAARTHLSCQIREAVTRGKVSPEDLRRVGSEAPSGT